MLRERAEKTGPEIDLSAALAGDGERIGVPYSALLIQFAEAVLGADDILLDSLCDRLMAEMGDATLSVPILQFKNKP